MFGGIRDFPEVLGAVEGCSGGCRVCHSRVLGNWLPLGIGEQPSSEPAAVTAFAARGWRPLQPHRPGLRNGAPGLGSFSLRSDVPRERGRRGLGGRARWGAATSLLGKRVCVPL